MKPTERATFRDFNKSPFIKSPIKENISTTAHKISFIVQVQLGGVDLPTDKSFNRRQYLAEQNIVFDRINRLVRCVVDCKESDCDAVATQNALELARSISAEYWEHMPAQLRQIPQIGVAAMRKLVQSQINSVEKLATMDSATIERILSRNPPFGQKMLDVLKDFPHLTMKAEIIGKILNTGQNPKVKIKASLSYSNPRSPFWRRQTPSLTFVGSVSSGKLAHVWRGSIKKLEKGFDVIFIAELLCPSDAVSCFLACDDIVGTVQTAILTPDILASSFPPVKASVAAKPRLPKEDEEDEDQDEDFKWDDLEDQDLLAVVKNAEDSKKTYDDDTWLDRFIDIDDLDIYPMDSKATKNAKENYEASEPVQMANGRWMCNHNCRDGRILKNGQACKHKCCHEGLAKPPKVVRKKFSTDISQDAKKLDEGSEGRPAPSNAKSKEPKLRLKSSPNETINLREVEVIDLEDILPTVEYENIAPPGFRNLHALHSKVQKTSSIKTLKEAAPAASFVKNSDLSLSSLHEKDSGWGYQDGGDYLSNNLPPLLKLMSHEDDFGEGPSSAYDVDMLDADGFAAMDEEFGMDTDLYMSMCVGNGYSSLSSPPEVTKSFQNAVFDFAAYNPANASSSPSTTQTLATQINSLKRPAGVCGDTSLAAMKRVKGHKEWEGEGICEEMGFEEELERSEEEVGEKTEEMENKKENAAPMEKEKQQPEWLKEFDPELVAMLAGFVDFVDQ
jgi:ATP-dependent DNA helicase HFM1/MER3